MNKSIYIYIYIYIYVHCLFNRVVQRDCDEIIKGSTQTEDIYVTQKLSIGLVHFLYQFSHRLGIVSLLLSESYVRSVAYNNPVGSYACIYVSRDFSLYIYIYIFLQFSELEFDFELMISSRFIPWSVWLVSL